MFTTKTKNIFSDHKAKPAKMSKAHPPELKKFMDKRIHLRINGSRQVSSNLFVICNWILNKFSVQVEGTLCGFDPFMNLVLSDAIEFPKAGGQNKIGMS